MRRRGNPFNHLPMNLVQEGNVPALVRTLSVRSVRAPFWTPLALLFGASLIFWCTEIDETWMRHFWSPADGWLQKDHPLVQFLYRYGTWPALFVGVAGALVCLASWMTGRWSEWRPLGWFLALLLVLGPGLTVNVLFKDHFGRARPVQTQEFGGKESFSPLGLPGGSTGGKSFPCGHASMGFYWLGLFVYFWHRRRELAWAFCALGLLHGMVMGWGRLTQGGHWPSDVLWAAAFVYFTAWGLQRLPAWLRLEDVG